MLRPAYSTRPLGRLAETSPSKNALRGAYCRASHRRSVSGGDRTAPVLRHSRSSDPHSSPVVALLHQARALAEPLDTCVALVGGTVPIVRLPEPRRRITAPVE